MDFWRTGVRVPLKTGRLWFDSMIVRIFPGRIVVVQGSLKLLVAVRFGPWELIPTSYNGSMRAFEAPGRGSIPLVGTVSCLRRCGGATVNRFRRIDTVAHPN